MRDPKLVEAIRLGGTVRLGDGRLVTKVEDLPDDYAGDEAVESTKGKPGNARGDARKIAMLTNDLNNAVAAHDALADANKALTDANDALVESNKALTERLGNYEDLFVRAGVIGIDDLDENDHDANFILINDRFLEVAEREDEEQPGAQAQGIEFQLPSGRVFRRSIDGAMVVVDGDGTTTGIARVPREQLDEVAQALGVSTDGNKSAVIKAIADWQP